MAVYGKVSGNSEDTVLPDDVKARLRAEEVVREKVRRKQRGKLCWLNQPIVIWGLSSVVLGTISFVYTRVNENTQKELRNYEQATVVRREIRFRVRQVEELVSRYDDADRAVDQLNDTDLSSIIADNALSDSGNIIRTYFRTAVLLAVVSDLGGSGTSPSQRRALRCGSVDPDTTILRFQVVVGINAMNFKNLSLEDLLIEYHLLMSNKQDLEAEQAIIVETIAAFGKAAEPSDVVSRIPGIATNALTMRVWSTEADTETIKTMIGEVRRWAADVRDAWRDLSTIMTAVAEST